MIKYSEIPLFLFLVFTLIYATIGNPNNEIWSGSYFFVNYLTLFFLLKDYKNKIIRITGIALSISILLFIVSKFFLHLQIQRYYTIIPFTIALIAIVKLEKIKK